MKKRIWHQLEGLGAGAIEVEEMATHTFWLFGGGEGRIVLRFQEGRYVVENSKMDGGSFVDDRFDGIDNRAEAKGN